MEHQEADNRDRQTPAEILDEAIDLLLDIIEDGRQRLEEAASTAEWVKLAGAVGQAETRLAQLLGTQKKIGWDASQIDEALMQAIREWHEGRTTSTTASAGTERIDPPGTALQGEISQGGQSR
jgi:hypothetical protein